MTRSTYSTNRLRRWLTAAAVLAALCLAGGALLGRQPAAAQEPLPPRVFSPGAMGLTRGQSARHIFHLHDDHRAGGAACRLTLEDTEGNTLVDTEFPLTYERSVVADLSVLEDGSVRFNGQRLNITVRRGSPLEIVPCIRVLNLSRSMSLIATAQCVNNLRGDPHGPVALGQTTYALTYGEVGAHETEIPSDSR